MLTSYQRAEKSLDGMVHDSRHFDVIASIDQSRQGIASTYGRSGRDEPRRQLLTLHIHMLERLSESAGGDPAISLLAALVRLDLEPDQSATAKLISAPLAIPGRWKAPKTVRG